MKSIKEFALYYASLGIPVFPCRPGNKAPYLAADRGADGKAIVGTGGFHKASVDCVEVSGWWDRWPEALIGFPTGERSGIDLLDLDKDEKKGKDGASEIPDWDTRSNIIVQTPRGGVHLWYKANGKAIGCTTDQIAHGVDTRGVGGYAFLPPSRSVVGEYKFIRGNELEISKLREFPVDLLARMKPIKHSNVEANVRIPTGDIELIKLALAAMSNDDMDWIEWNNVGMAAWAASGGSGEGFLAFATWSRKSEKFDLDHTRERWSHFADSPPDRTGEGKLFALAYAANPGWDDAYHKRLAEGGVAGGEVSAAQIQWMKDNIPGFKDSPKPVEAMGVGNGILPPVGQSNNSRLAVLNERFCILPVAGKMRILEFTRVRDRNMAVFYTPYDFKVMLDNILVKIENKKNGDPQYVGQGTWWLGRKDRRQYNGLVFQPGKEQMIDGCLNLWRGWGITPKKGTWKLFRRHILEVLANGNKEFDEYIIKWTAWTFQNPDKPAEVVLMFRGGKGTGKGLFGRELKRAFGQHGLHISSAGHLSGRFNAHLMDCSLLFADEAFWPGDKASEGTFKRMITEATLFVERKGVDGFEVDNCLHIVLGSNSDWIVPASVDERRIAASDVCEKNKQKEDYFIPLYNEIENGGTAAMMFDLLNMDLGDWHPRKSVPRNAALADQQTQSLSHLDQWWVDLLQAGQLPGASDKNPSLARSAVLFEHARATAPGLRFVSDHLLGRFLRKQGCGHGSRIGGPSGPRGWLFPPLSAARAAWGSQMKTVWDNPELSDWQIPSF